MNSSTIDLASINSVQDGSQNNSQCCINKRAWTSAKKIWIAMIKNMPLSWTESSLVTKQGSTITSRSVNGRVWNGNIKNRLSGKSSKANHQQENWRLQFLGLTRPNTGTLSGEGFNNKQCSLQWDAYWQAEAWISKQKPRISVERHYVVAWQIPVRILPPTQFKPSRNSSLRYWLTLRTVPNSPLQTNTCLVQSRRH